MNKIKDLLYDKNDILVAMLILCIAVFVIFTRVNSIMDYPERMFSLPGSGGGTDHTLPPERPDAGLSAPGNQGPPQVGDDGDNGDGDHGDGDNGDNGDGDGDNGDGAEDPADGSPPEAHSLYIASGQSMTTVARNLVELGLFENERDFITTLEAHNASARVQAGTFIIPADSTKDDVIRIITGR